MYQFCSRVRYSETDSKGRMSHAALMNYFQDSSTFHSEELGASGDSLRTNNMAWVLSFWQVCIKKLPVLSEEIKVSTWPYETKNLFGMRNFTMEDKDGCVIAYANSIWVLVDVTTGRPMRIPAEVAAYYPDEPRLEMDYCQRKIAIPEEFEQADAFFVGKGQIDTNHHVNNVNYVAMAEEYLPEDFEVKEIRVEYKKAAVYQDKICPRVTVRDSEVTVVLSDDEGNIYAIVLFAK